MSALSRQASTTPAIDLGSAGPSVPYRRTTTSTTSNARPGPSTSNVIDLTSSSPPTSHRALPAAGPSNGLRLPAPAPRRDGLRTRGNAGASGSGGRAAAEVIELSSDEEEAVVLDDDSDGEVVVQGVRGAFVGRALRVKVDDDPNVAYLIQISFLLPPLPAYLPLHRLVYQPDPLVKALPTPQDIAIPPPPKSKPANASATATSRIKPELSPRLALPRNAGGKPLLFALKTTISMV